MVNMLAEGESGLSNLPDRRMVRKEIANVLRRLRRNKEDGELVLVPKLDPIPQKTRIHAYTVTHEPFYVVPKVLIHPDYNPKVQKKASGSLVRKVQATPPDYDEIIRQCKEKSAASPKGHAQKQ
ncbi:MAG: hypothetical protein KGH94_04615 [Candidatus Micrarchaeota archaeon]|nr:hypothetical protein [Candidatus Micrarchaeota archaeon]